MGNEGRIPVEAVSGVGGAACVAEAGQDLARALDQHIGRLRRRRQAEQRAAIGEVCAEHECSDSSQQPGPGGRDAQLPDAARRRDDVGRGRLTGRDQPVERVAAARQQRRDGPRRRRPRERVLLQAWLDEALDPLGARQRREAGRFWFAVLREHVRERTRVVERHAHEHLEQHEAQRVEVTARGGLVSRELLRRHVSGSSGKELALGRSLADGQPEVRDAGAAAPVDHDVGRLQVAVHDALVVHGRESGAQVARELERLVRRQPADARQERREILAVHVLHRDEVPPVDLHHVVEPAHVRVRDLAPDAHLGEQPLQEHGIVGHAAPKELERDWLTELDVLCPVDFAHAAPAERRDDPIAAGEQSSRREDQFVAGRMGSWRAGARRCRVALDPIRERLGGARLAGPVAWRWPAGHDCFLERLAMLAASPASTAPCAPCRVPHSPAPAPQRGPDSCAGNRGV